MTRELLEGYRSKKEEIRELEYKLEHLGDGDSMMGCDTIYDYQTGYPKPQAVVGVDWAKIERLETRYKKRIAQLKAECADVELWIEEIPDSLTRRMFRMCYVDGMTFQQIGQKCHVDKSTVSRKINNYFIKLQRMQQMQQYNEK